MCNLYKVRQGFQKLSSDRQTDRQTRPKIYHAASRVVKNTRTMRQGRTQVTYTQAAGVTVDAADS